MKKIYILSLVLSFTVCFAQTNLKKADALFKNYAYADASKAYEEILQNIKNPSAQTLKMRPIRIILFLMPGMLLNGIVNCMKFREII